MLGPQYPLRIHQVLYFKETNQDLMVNLRKIPLWLWQGKGKISHSGKKSQRMSVTETLSSRNALYQSIIPFRVRALFFLQFPSSLLVSPKSVRGQPWCSNFKSILKHLITCLNLDYKT